MDFLRYLLKRGPWDAIVDFMVYTTNDFSRRVDMLLNATKQYVYLSSSRVYAESPTPLREDSPRLLDICGDKEYLATDEYALAKARQEDLLKNSGRKNWTIIRPYITFSEIRLQLSPLEKEYWLYRALKGKPIVFSKDLSERYTTITYGFDVARGIAAIIGEDAALGETFHITSNETYQWSEIMEIYMDVIERYIGHRPKIMLTDKWSCALGGAALQVKFDRLYDRRFDNSKINRFVDTRSFKPVKSALSDCLASFLGNPQFREIDWGSEARKDKLLGEWTRINEIEGIKQKAKYLLIRFGLHE